MARTSGLRPTHLALESLTNVERILQLVTDSFVRQDETARERQDALLEKVGKLIADALSAHDDIAARRHAELIGTINSLGRLQ